MNDFPVRRARVARARLRRLARHLAQGGVFAYPTESCFGLGASPYDVRGLKAVIGLKKRVSHKGLIVIGAEFSQFGRLLAPVKARAELDALWPVSGSLKRATTRATTVVLPCRRAPLLLRGKGRSALAVRVSHHPVCQTLTRHLGALVSTSANRSGERPCKTARDVRRRFPGVMLVDGRIGQARAPSRILDWTSGKELR